MLSVIGELEPRFRKSGQQQLLVETLLVRFALLDRTVEIEDLLRGLNGEGGESAAPPPRRASASPRDAAPRTARESAPTPASDNAPQRTTTAVPDERQVASKPPTMLADISPVPMSAPPTSLGVSREPLDVARL